MSVSTAPTPPLLLTKRLGAFLHTHQSAQLPTLLLITPHGKLLAHASPHGVALLRIHATVAASLLTIHTGCSVAIPAALPGSGYGPGHGHGHGLGFFPAGDDSSARSRESSPAADSDDERHGPRYDDHGGRHGAYRGAHREDDRYEDDDDDDEEEGYEGVDARGRGVGAAVQPGTITVQLSGGTVVIRRLACGLLFVCIGPPANADPGVADEGGSHGHAHAHAHTHGHAHAHTYTHAHSAAGSSPSEADSAMSSSAVGAGSGSGQGAGSGAGAGQDGAPGIVTAMRKRAGELARRLDEKLGTLKVPGEGGVEVV